MTAPPLICLEDFGGDWSAYETALYAVFVKDIITHNLQFRGVRVGARRMPEHDRKWACFWHLISEGHVEDDRTPDLRRCEHLPLIRWVIENADATQSIDVWEQTRQRERNWVLWYDEYYLIILAQRGDYLLLKTAFCTEPAHRVQKFRKERDNYNAAAS